MTKALKISLFLIAIGFVSYLLISLPALEIKSIRQITAVIAITAVAFFLNSTEFAVLYKAQGIKIGLGESHRIFSVGQLLNYAPGQVGTIYRFREMKQTFGASYTDSSVTMATNFVLSALATGVIGLSATLALGIIGEVWVLPLLAIFAAISVVTATAGLIRVPQPNTGRRVPKYFRKFNESWGQVQQKKVVGLTVLLLEVSRLLLAAWRLQLILGWLEISASFIECAVVAPLGSLAVWFSITPSALGIRELIIGLGARLLNMDFSDGLASSSIERVAAIFAVLIAIAVSLLVRQVLGRPKNYRTRSLHPKP